MSIQVGSTIRATMPSHLCRRRALVALILHDDCSNAGLSQYSLIWEDEAPRKIEGISFIVSPEISEDRTKSSSDEEIVSESDISDLFGFELVLSKPRTNDHSAHKSLVSKDYSATYWKECGDILLRERDAAAAVSFYELALTRTSCIQVGSMVLVQRANKAGASTIVRANVDCINEDENTIDLTMDDDVEETLPTRQVRLSIDPQLSDLQERILLNLSRCLFYLADQCPSHRRSAYLQSVRLGCSLALALPAASEHESSMLLRSHAFAASNKLPQALADVHKVLSRNPKSREGQKLLKDLECQKAFLNKVNKRLAKDINQWVHVAINHKVPVIDEKTSRIQHRAPNASSFTSFPWHVLVFFVILSLILQAVISYN